MGLYLARKRAKAIGGTLSYRAPADSGARFILMVPLSAQACRE